MYNSCVYLLRSFYSQDWGCWLHCSWRLISSAPDHFTFLLRVTEAGAQCHRGHSDKRCGEFEQWPTVNKVRPYSNGWVSVPQQPTMALTSESKLTVTCRLPDPLTPDMVSFGKKPGTIILHENRQGPSMSLNNWAPECVWYTLGYSMGTPMNTMWTKINWKIGGSKQVSKTNHFVLADLSKSFPSL